MSDTPGVVLEGLRTHYGTLSLRMDAGEGVVHADVGGAMRVPPGGIVLRTPLDRPIRRARVNGRVVRLADPNEVTIRQVPAEIVLEH